MAWVLGNPVRADFPKVTLRQALVVSRIFLETEKQEMDGYFFCRGVLNRTWKSEGNPDYPVQPFWTLTWWNPVEEEYVCLIVPAGGKIEKIKAPTRESLPFREKPKISEGEAMDAVERYMEDHSLAVDGFEISIVDLIPPNRDHPLYWRIQLRNPGEITPVELRVTMDGAVTRF